MNNIEFNNPLADLQRTMQKQADQAMMINRMIVNEKVEAKVREQEWRDEMLAETKHTRVTLEHTNELLEQKLTEVNETLDFILNSMGGNFQRIERMQLLTNKSIQEVAEILEERDSHRLGEYIKEHGMEAFGTILNVLAFMAQK